MARRERKARTVGTISVLAVAVLLLLALLVVGVARFNNVTDQIEREAEQRKEAFCGLAYLFDESIRISGRAPEGRVGIIYQDWRRSISAVDCPQEAP